MRFSIIIPAHNEEATLFFCLQSLLAQTYPHFEVVVVDDGSDDKTPHIIEEFSKKDGRFSGVSLPISGHSPGAKVVQTFNEGLKSIEPKEVICKFDADIIFPPDYLQKLTDCFKENEKLGMVSGIVYIPTSKIDFSPSLLDFSSKENWQFEAISSKNHIRGPIKAYRKECFEAMNGLRPVLGWDNIDVMLAQKVGFSVQTVPTLWVKHLRPTAHLYREAKYRKLGQYFRNIGLSGALCFISASKVAWKDRSVRAFFIIFSQFLKTPSPQFLSKEEISFIRNLRWRMFFKKFL